MAQPCGGANLTIEALADLVAFAEAGLEDLERDVASERLFVRELDDAHGASSELALDREAGNAHLTVLAHGSGVYPCGLAPRPRNGSGRPVAFPCPLRENEKSGPLPVLAPTVGG